MDSIIYTTYGAIRGRKHEWGTSYLGVPFAKPPIGELTFRHPVPPEPWDGIREAVNGSANPVQAPGGFVVGNNSLDCLYLNVFVPDNAEETEGPLPVMVWIYGGSYSQGGAGAVAPGSSELQYDLSLFASETNCIVVSFNYRLNLYGFLNINFLNEAFDRNNGLYDQIAALKFVKNNIAAFGGDPDNITVFGQSAGGACILALMTMPEADGLFCRAIVQSACIRHFFTEEESERNTRIYMRCAGLRDAEQLMSMRQKEVRRANIKYAAMQRLRGDIRCAFSPVIDGVSLTAAPEQAVKDSHLSLLIGTTSGEANRYGSYIPEALLPLAMKFIRVRVDKGEASYRQRAAHALTDHIYVHPMKEILKGYNGCAWRYEYGYVLPESKGGSFHASELPVLFDLNNMFGRVDDPVSESVGREMRQIWGRFARTGDPGWSRYSETNYQPFLIDRRH